MVDAIWGISVILRTQKAKGHNLKACNLLKRNFMAELFMEYFPTFSKHLSNIVWSSNLVNLVALQPADFESTNPAKWKFFESSRVGELLLAKYQCKWQNFGKTDKNIEWFQHTRSPSNFKNYRENSQETFAAETVFSILMEGRLEISIFLKGILLTTIFWDFP